MQSRDQSLDIQFKIPLVSKIKHSVRFEGVDKIHEIPSVEDLTDEEMTAIWYNQNEFDNMKKSSSAEIQHMRSGLSSVEGNEHCMRGLEFKTRQGSFLRKQNVYKAFVLLMREQARQKAKGMNDPQLIANIYRKAANQCERAAYIRGLRDALDVNDSQLPAGAEAMCATPSQLAVGRLQPGAGSRMLQSPFLKTGRNVKALNANMKGLSVYPMQSVRRKGPGFRAVGLRGQA